MAISSSNNKKIALRTSDGELFEVSEPVALQSETIKHMIEDGCADDTIPLPNVTSKVLAKVLDFCSRHVEEKKEYAELVSTDQELLFDLILAANYLNIKGLLDLTCQVVADETTGKTGEQIRKTFHIENDYIVEEEETFHIKNDYAPKEETFHNENDYAPEETFDIVNDYGLEEEYKLFPGFSGFPKRACTMVKGVVISFLVPFTRKTKKA